MPRNDRENGRRHQYGLGRFEQAQFERPRGPEVERSRPETVGRHGYHRDRDDRRRYEMRPDTRDYRRDDDDYDRNERSWFDRARDNVRGWFHRDEDEYVDRRDGYMSEREARRLATAEGQRTFDLRRWGLLESTMNAYFAKEKERLPHLGAALAVTSRHLLYPIPNIQIELSKVGGATTLVQNPGW